MEYKFKEITIDELFLIEGLWIKLNEVHYEDSKFFKEDYATNTFAKRCAKFMIMNSQDIRIDVIENHESNVIGYCISTANKGVGEIESIFIEQDHRQHGLGSLLIDKAIEWLKVSNCNKIILSVADGHESVFDFYMKKGFYPRLTYLELKE